MIFTSVIWFLMFIAFTLLLLELSGLGFILLIEEYSYVLHGNNINLIHATSKTIYHIEVTVFLFLITYSTVPFKLN